MNRFSFSGTAREYFGIWIVNLLLTLVTLGVYSAWAKVRRLRYFYGNTFLDGHNFDYHARPVQILIGRIIVIVLLIGYNILVSITPIAFVLLIPYALGFPWIINKALRFSARMTSHRNIRFGFEGNYWSAFFAFIIMPLAAFVTAGFLAPLASREVSNYIGNNMRFGNAPFATAVRLRPLYRNWFASIGFGLIWLVAAIATGAAIGGILFAVSGTLGLNGASSEEIAKNPVIVTVGTISAIGLYSTFFFGYFFYQCGVRNLAYQATVLQGEHPLHSDLSRGRYVWILISNAFIILATVGLMRPWAAIRSWRYKSEHTALSASAPVSEIVAASEREGNVATAEFLDIEGIDFGL
ncbi:MAG: YjgN family protein [Flavobacteriaceae bacterium]